jgi:small subunit ribosomal protein S15
VKPLTRRAKLDLLRKLKDRKEKLGEKFKFLQKTRRYPGIPGYQPPKPDPRPRILDHFNTRDTRDTRDSRDSQVIDTTTGTPVIDTTDNTNVAFGLSKSDLEFLLKTLPALYKDSPSHLSIHERSNILAKFIDINNSNQSQISKLNIQSSINLLKRHEFDIGSPEIQVAIHSIRIMALKKHLEQFRKDNDAKKSLLYWSSKRERMLKYLKRADLEKFVHVCKLVGVDSTKFSAV